MRNNSPPSEIELWKALRAGNLHGYKFNRQKPLDEYIVDFYCRRLKLVIEIDGDSHDDKKAYDRRRQQRLEYDHDVMQHLDGVLTEIERTIPKLEKSK